MKNLVRWFIQGLVVLVPTTVTIYVFWWLAVKLNSLTEPLGIGIPGLGIVLTLSGIVLIGFLASSVLGRRVVGLIEGGLERLPIVKLLFGSLRDLLTAFVGESRSFGQPVVVELSEVSVLGFLTCESFETQCLKDKVAVYLPQSYNFAGNLIVVDREQVRFLDVEGAQLLAFILSGGLADGRKAPLRRDSAPKSVAPPAKPADRRDEV